MVNIVHVTPWDFVKGVDTFPKTITIPSVTAGHKLVFLSGGGAITTPVGFVRRDVYGLGAQDVSIWEYTAVGGETSVTFSLNGPENVSGAIVEAGAGLTFVSYSNNGSGTTPTQAGDFQLRPGSSVTASGQGTIFTIATAASTATYSSANRLRQYGPRGKVLREGGNQPGHDAQFVFQVGVSDVDATHSYPPSLSAGNYRTTTDWIGSGTTCFISQVLFADSSGVASAPSSGIVTVDENSLPGTDYNNYFLGTAGTSSDICGYTDFCSYGVGDTVNFKVFSNNSPARVELYRRGFYDRETFGARNVLGNGDGYITITPTVQPAPSVDSTTGATSCSWTTNASWTIPAGTPSGLYYIVFRRTDISAFSSGHFIVRSSSVSGKAVVVVPDIGSHQPYNIWGDPSDHGDRATGSWTGLDLYQGGPDAALPNFAHRGYAVSFDRPYGTQSSQDSTYINDSTIGQIAFLEAQGYDLTYISDVDLEGSSHYLDNAACVILSGHHEYVTTDGYNAYRNAEAAGVNVACLSSNTCLWRVHFDSTDTNHRIVMCYKESGTLDISAGFTGSGYDPGDSNSTPEYSGTWRDYRTISGAVNNPDTRRENSTFGQIFMASGPIQVQAIVDQIYQSSPAFRNSTSILALTSGGTFLTSSNCSGFELDSRDGSVGEPTNIVDIFRHLYTATHNIANDVGSTYGGIADIEIGYTLFRDDSSQALILCTGAWRCMWPCTRWQSSAPSGPTIDLDWQNMFLCLFYDLGLVPNTLSSMRPGEDSDVTNPATGAPGPGRTAIALAYGLTVSSQAISAESRAGEESFGSVTVTPGSISIPVTGIVTAEGLGSVALTTSVTTSPKALPSAEVIGNLACTGVTSVASQGIPTGEAFGSQSIILSNTITPTGIPSESKSGVPQAIQFVECTSHSSEEAFGIAGIFGLNTIQATGISTTEKFGALAAATSTTVTPAGFDSSGSIGNSSVLSTVTATPIGLPSDAKTGNANVSGLNTVTVEAITSTEVIGSLTLSSIDPVLPAGISSFENFGSAQALPGSVTTTAKGIPSSEIFGIADVIIGFAEIQPAGITPNESFGNCTVTNSIVSSVNALASDAVVSSLQVTTSYVATPVSNDFTGKIGAPSVTSSIVESTVGIPSDSTVGAIQTAATATVNMKALPSDSSIGPVAVSLGAVTISPAGIDSASSIGAPTVAPGSITAQATGILSTEKFGAVSAGVGTITITPTGFDASGSVTSSIIAQAGPVTINGNGIDSSTSFGTVSISLTVTVNPNGVTSDSATGNALLDRVVSLAGISSSASSGNPGIAVGTVTIHATGISSTAIFGSILVELAIAFVRVDIGEPELLFTAQAPQTSWDADAQLLWVATL